MIQAQYQRLSNLVQLNYLTEHLSDVFVHLTDIVY